MTTVETKKQQRQETLLGVIYLFSRLGKEISLSEIQNSVRQFQRRSHLGYSFPKRFNYSHKLMTDLKDLTYTGSLHEYNYRHDSFLPEKYFKLTPLGIGQGKKIVSQLSKDLLEYLEDT